MYFQRLGQPIQDRHREQEDRPRAFEELGKKLQLYIKFVNLHKQKVQYLTISCLNIKFKSIKLHLAFTLTFDFRQLPFQDERYVHLSAEEMSSVEKCVNGSMAWMNSKMNAQSKLTVTQNPVVKVADIITKIQVFI